MSRKRRGSSLTNEELADLIDQIAERIARGDRSFDIQLPLTEAQKALVKLRYLDGVKLLNRIGLLLLNEGKESTDFFYPGVKETLETFPPLDPVQDGNALRILADTIRNNKINPVGSKI